MKRVNLLLISLIVAFSGVSGCRRTSSAVARNDARKINVVTTIFPAYDFVRQIAGDMGTGGSRVNLSMLLPPGAESHSFEPTPRDILAIQNSDIFIYTGSNSEKWVDRILQSMDTGKMKIYAMMDSVSLVEEEIVEGMEDEGDEEESSYDEHIWTSPQNAKLIVRAIADLLCKADAANAEFYRENATAYIEELEQLDAAFADVVTGVKRGTIVFADRFPFRYLADAYGLSYYAAFPGCSAEAEPSAATVAFLINKIKSEKIPVVFHIELSNERMADTICGETGAKKLLLHSCHNITKRDFDSGIGYLELMRGNVVNLREALD